MAATVLTVDYYDAVRALIAPDVTDAHISDAYLSQGPFVPEAERKVRKRLRTAKIDVDTLIGDSIEDARLAMMHACAAVLCLTVPQMLRQTQLQVVTEVQSIGWQEKRKFHESEVDDLLDDIRERVKEGTSTSKPARALPFGAVGTMRSEKGAPAYPWTRTSAYGR